MKRFFEIFNKIFAETPGNIASVSFLLCVLSGVFLAIPYDVGNPFDSIGLMLLDNPAAVFLRNIHYWTAQFFFVFTILHLLDHLVRKTEYLVGSGVWLRLVISLPVILFVMISGFILKGDPDAVSAFSILSALTGKIPLAGEMINSSFLGRAGNLQLIYVHHIATASIFLLFIILEHTRVTWPRLVTFLVMTFLFLILSYFLQAPFGTDTGKGPWYFTGLQELLHWMTRPGWAWMILFLLLILFWVMPKVGFGKNSLIKRVLGGMALFYAILTIIGIFFRGEEWRLVWPRAQDIRQNTGVAVMPLTTKLSEDFGFSGTIPLIMGRREGCLVCHQKTAGFSPAHDPIALGCSTCHGGDPLTLNKRLAHRGMRSIPGNMADAALSCGTAQCHPSITGRVPTSIMTTASGIVTVDRWVFGEEESLSALAHIMHIGHSPADQHLRDLCANCHLGNPKTEAGPVNQQTRGGGCNACHLGYDPRSIASLRRYSSTGLIPLADTFYHPSLSLNITDEHCFGCHSRSGRIATNYQGWHETLLDAADMPGDGRHRLLEDQRVFEFAGADVHHQKGLQCIDCHHSYELMGDGNYYAHKEEQVSITCQDCHFNRKPETLHFDKLDAEAMKILAVRQWPVEGKRFIKPAGSDYALVNAWLDRESRGWQKIKATGREVYLQPPLSECTRGEGHRALSCESCHTAWVPQCIGCHNAYDRNASGYDMLEGKDKKGSWVEYVGQFMHGPPTLGIVENPAGKNVRTFVPGMVLSIDTLSYFRDQGSVAEGNMIFRRLFAPVSAHTTVRRGRSCKSCHNDPVALGYGQGQLVFETIEGSGHWTFTPRFAANKYDGLPEDAWIGFLDEPEGAMATREHARPFSRGEQIRILTVGACLTCHEETSRTMVTALDDFEALKRRISTHCVMPRWD